MSLSKSLTVSIAVAGLAFTVASTSSVAQSADRPQLSGIWSNASRTSLTRPRGVELVVTAEEAQEIGVGG